MRGTEVPVVQPVLAVIWNCNQVGSHSQGGLCHHALLPAGIGQQPADLKALLGNDSLLPDADTREDEDHHEQNGDKKAALFHRASANTLAFCTPFGEALPTALTRKLNPPPWFHFGSQLLHQSRANQPR